MVCIRACGKKLGFFSKEMLFLSNKILQKVKDSEDLGGWLLSKREKFDLFKVMSDDHFLLFIKVLVFI